MAARKKSSSKKTARKKKTPRKAAAKAASPSLADRIGEAFEQVAAGALRRLVDVGGRELGSWLPEASELRHETGVYIRELRELAGLTVDELAEAIELRDRSLLEAVEAGTATLSFELILRLAAILARHDPAPFVSKLARSYNPVLWDLLEEWGLSRLPLQAVREREFVNILRSRDDARELSDKDFARVLEFTREAFETALHFAAKSKRKKRTRRA